ncbi:response regulator [Alishewanella sp. SMS8]|uniref:response regulator n=1 Tax=Alishewanella sp. SMS8 TaxID=2994676 RepID=UPI002741B6BC|nr:response regulator [Alishewanella sp. SMS8]MDP5458027.1 response regulator [Alishewanella sp. SMS8]
MTCKQNYNEVTILLIDDDDVDVMGVKRALKQLKILNPIIRARDGVEGLAIIRDTKKQRKSYIVLLDINMPRMDGLEMLYELRNDPHISNSIVFILTTSKADEDKAKAYNQHIAGYIVKNQVAEGFVRVVELLDSYWRLVELPSQN